MQNQNWVQVPQNPQPVIQVPQQQNAWFLTHCCFVCALLAVFFGFQILSSGISLSILLGFQFFFVIALGALLLFVGVFLCIKRHKARTEALMAFTTTYVMTQAQVPQYPVASPPAHTTVPPLYPPPAGSYPGYPAPVAAPYPGPNYEVSQPLPPISQPPPYGQTDQAVQPSQYNFNKTVV